MNHSNSKDKISESPSPLEGDIDEADSLFEPEEKSMINKNEPPIEFEEEIDITKDSEANRIEELTQEVINFKENLQRERAEFINYRKRVVQEKSELESSIMAKVVDTVLPTLDAFDQLFSSFEEDKEKSLNNFVTGAELIQKQLVSAFEKYGVEEFSPKSEAFDPENMEALHSEESDKVDHDVVEQIYQKGYKINGRLIRAARVSVLKPKKNEK